MVQIIKMALKACAQEKGKDVFFLPRRIYSYRTIRPAGRLVSPSALTGRQISVPLTMSYLNEKMCYKENKETLPEKANFLMRNESTQLQ